MECSFTSLHGVLSHDLERSQDLLIKAPHFDVVADAARQHNCVVKEQGMSTVRFLPLYIVIQSHY